VTQAWDEHAASDPLPAARGADPLVVLRCLTDRDRRLVSVLAEHQVLTTTQVTQLAFPSLDVAQRRLLRLTRLGILDRFRWHALVGSEASALAKLRSRSAASSSMFIAVSWATVSTEETVSSG